MCLCVCLRVYVSDLKTPNVNKTEQLVGREGEGSKTREAGTCESPSAGYRYPISHVDGYPSVRLKFTSVHIQRYAHTHTHTQWSEYSVCLILDL